MSMKKSTKVLHLHHKMKVVSLFGVALFVAAVAVQAVLAGTTYWHLRTFDIDGGVNAAGSFLLVMVAALIPPLAAYLVGDKATKVRSEYEHHYNGILFAFLTVWLGLAVTVVAGSTLGEVRIPYLDAELNRLWPAAIALMIAIAIGISYGAHRHQKPLHDYLLFKLVFIGALATFIAAGFISTLVDILSPYPSIYGWALLVPIAIVVLMMVVPLTLSKEKTFTGKLMEAMLAVSAGIFAIMVASQIPFSGLGIATSIVVPALVGIVTWLAFLYYYFYRKTD